MVERKRNIFGKIGRLLLRKQPESDDFEENLFKVDLKDVRMMSLEDIYGGIPYPFAQVESKLYVLEATFEGGPGSREAAVIFHKSLDEQLKEKRVLGPAFDRDALGSKKLIVDQWGAGIWRKVEDVPEAFKKAFEESQ